jgi:DNA-binding transcriptional MerR regulator
MAQSTVVFVTPVAVRHHAVVPEYRIDDLARAAGTTVRNVRAYQERGLIAPPRRVGRAAVYDETHLARLRLVLELLEQGVTLQLIGDLVEAWQGGHNIADLLGLEAALLAPGADRPGDQLSTEELEALFGVEADAGDVARAVELGILAPEGDGYRVLAPRLLQIGTEIAQMGVPVGDMLEHVAGLRTRIEDVAHDFVELAVRHVFAELVDDVESADLGTAATLIQRLRPLAKSVVDLELSRALDAEITARIAEVLAGEA